MKKVDKFYSTLKIHETVIKFIINYYFIYIIRIKLLTKTIFNNLILIYCFISI